MNFTTMPRNCLTNIPYKDILDTVTLEELGRLARRVRMEANLTQTQVAEMLSETREVAQSHVSLAERGQSRYSSLAIRIIEEIGGASVETLYRVSFSKEE